ncbi:complex I NDUFA9 subunit family protein [SAR202 cluster bacterium AC-647-N09_OGT_505m]|nr:complex I NDUFA9 subunit family protein [SAR202 cluster bacterium AC-647-N09_OGT_505m]
MILVTGASGFVGRSVVKALRTRGKEVRCFIRTPYREKTVADYHVEMAYGDILSLSALKGAMRGVDTVVHLVAIIREKRNENFDLINRRGTEIVTQAAREEGIRHFVHMSANGAQDNPSYPYLHSKWQGEQAVISSGLTYTIFRPSIQFGDGDEFINTLAGMIKAFPLVPVVGLGKIRLQPISVDEVGAMISLVIDNPRFGGRTIEIGGPDQLTYNEIIDIIGRTLKVKRLRAHLPVPLMKVLTRIMETVIPNPPATTSQLEMLALDNVTDIDSVEKLFKVKPRPLEGNIRYIRNMSLLDAWRIALGFMPKRIRDH